MIRSLIMLNICSSKATERMYVSKLANGRRDSTEHPVCESTVLSQIRSMRISSSMTLETWGIPGWGTAPLWPPDISIGPAHGFRRVGCGWREEERFIRGFNFTISGMKVMQRKQECKTCFILFLWCSLERWLFFRCCLWSNTMQLFTLK